MKIMQKIKVHGRACQHCDMGSSHSTVDPVVGGLRGGCHLLDFVDSMFDVGICNSRRLEDGCVLSEAVESRMDGVDCRGVQNSGEISWQTSTTVYHPSAACHPWSSD